MREVRSVRCDESSVWGRGLARRVFRRRRAGFAMMEVILAMSLFAAAGVGLAVALNQIARVGVQSRNLIQVERILNNELKRVLSIPRLEEAEQTRAIQELPEGELLTTVVLTDTLLNRDGQILQNMFEIRVRLFWREHDETQVEEAKTFRYGLLYRR